MKRVNTLIYNKMQALGILEVKDHVKIENGSWMPLSLEWIDFHNGWKVLSMCHYSECNGDLMLDPEILIRVDDKIGFASGISYRSDYLGVMDEVYSYGPEGEVDNVRIKKRDEVDMFLNVWLDNIKDQGYEISID